MPAYGPVGCGAEEPVPSRADDCETEDAEVALTGTRVLSTLALAALLGAAGLLVCSGRGLSAMAYFPIRQGTQAEVARLDEQALSNGSAGPADPPAERAPANGSTDKPSGVSAPIDAPAAQNTATPSPRAPAAEITTTPAQRTPGGTFTTTHARPTTPPRPHGNTSVLDSKPVIIFANTQYGLPGFRDGVVPDCSADCVIRRDAEALKTADVVVWNPRWMTPIKDITPSQVASKPRFQKWVFNFDFEAPVYKRSKVRSDITHRLAPGIDWTMTYKTSSNFFKPNFQLIPPKDNNVSTGGNYADGKNMLLLWFVSNCVEPRMSIFKRLTSYLPRGRSKIIGVCGEKSACGSHRREDETCLSEFVNQFKFYASFENSRCDGYITEKLSRAYDSGLVPVVWGGLKRADYEAVAPKDSFIHVDDFGSLELLAKHLMRLDKDDAAYNRYFEWKTRLHVVKGRDWALSRYCLLCHEVRKPLDKQQPTRTFGNLDSWWYSSCRSDAPH